MMSEVMNKLMDVELQLKQKVEDNVVKELQSRVEILEGKIREGSRWLHRTEMMEWV